MQMLPINVCPDYKPATDWILNCRVSTTKKRLNVCQTLSPSWEWGLGTRLGTCVAIALAPGKAQHGFYKICNAEESSGLLDFEMSILHEFQFSHVYGRTCRLSDSMVRYK